MFSYHKQLSSVHSYSSILYLHPNITARRQSSLCHFQTVTVHSALLQRHSDTLCKVTHQARWHTRHSDSPGTATQYAQWHIRHGDTPVTVTHQARWRTRHGDTRHVSDQQKARHSISRSLILDSYFVTFDSRPRDVTWRSSVSYTCDSASDTRTVTAWEVPSVKPGTLWRNKTSWGCGIWHRVAWQILSTVSVWYTSSLKVTAVGLSEKPVNFRQDTRPKILKYRKLRNYCCEKLSC